MNARDFKIIASSLVDAGKRPEDFRTSISRSYYAAFHVGSEVLRNMKIPLPNSSKAHDDLSNLLSNCNDMTLSKAGSQLDSLKSDRIKADYKLDNLDIETKNKAEIAYKQADRIIQILDGCNCDKERMNAVAKSIREYMKKTNYR